jgi:hypothetical protein
MSGHVSPVDADPHIYTYEAPYKTCQVTGHHAETATKPPAYPAAKRDTEYYDHCFHVSCLMREELLSKPGSKSAREAAICIIVM